MSLGLPLLQFAFEDPHAPRQWLLPLSLFEAFKERLKGLVRMDLNQVVTLSGQLLEAGKGGLAGEEAVSPVEESHGPASLPQHDEPRTRTVL